MRLDMRKWNAIRPLIRARLLSEGQHDLSNIVKKEIGADIYLTFYIALPSPEGEVVAWEVSPPFLDYWKGVDVDTLECVAKENMAGRTTLTKLSDMLKAYIKKQMKMTLPFISFRRKMQCMEHQQSSARKYRHV